MMIWFSNQMVFAQVNYIDSYIGNAVTLTTIATSANSLNQPRDLDFKPGTNELWVVNYGNSSGGTIVIIYDAGLPGQNSELREDSHNDHFMMYPSALAFGNDGKWANTNEIKNTGAASSTFMGPALWSGDTAIYAAVYQNNWAGSQPLGSHLDMLHQSPFSMGIAHDTNMVYWVLDGYNGNICKYDFGEDHGPGYDDHSAGKIWRYTDVAFARVPSVPSHAVVDHQGDWLYYIDGASKTIRRMNTNTGNFTANLSTPTTAQEPLAGYYKMEFANVEIIDTLLSQPCGIDFYNGRLLVSDYTTGDIYLYDMENNTYFRDTIVTGHAGMMGIKVAPDGRIWCVNKTENKIYRLDAGTTTVDAGITKINSPAVQNHLANFYSTGFNVCTGSISPVITVSNSGLTAITTMAIQFQLNGGTPVSFIWNGNLNSGNSTTINLPSTAVANGSHLLKVKITQVNGAADDIDLNNHYMGSFRVVDPPATIPVSEDFASSTFPPAGWNYINYNPNNILARHTTGGFGGSIGCAKMDNFSGPMDIEGQKDFLLSPVINLTGAPANTNVQFNVAYAQYDNTSLDALSILASIDCGNTWNSIYDKSGSTLSSNPNYATNNWTPAASNWRAEAVSLSSYVGQSDLILAFNFTSDWGNNLYVDDIYIGQSTVGITEPAVDFSCEVYPNPSSDELMMILNSVDASLAEINISDLVGKQMESFRSFVEAGENKLELNGYFLNQPSGVYFISVKMNNQTITKKITRL